MGRITTALAGLIVGERPKSRPITKFIACNRDKIRDPYVYDVNDTAVSWGPKREGAKQFDSVELAREALTKVLGAVYADQLAYTPITATAASLADATLRKDILEDVRL